MLVLAVVTELYLDAVGADSVIVSDDMVRAAPDLDAQRDSELGRLMLATSR